MSKPITKDQTLELIKNTAKDLFFVQGRFSATTQEIANQAGVTRTLINYYFRSRDNLLKIVFEEAQKVENEKNRVFFDTELSFKDKTSRYIQESLLTSIKYPYLETYIISQINKGSFKKRKKIEPPLLNNIYEEIEKEMQLGNIEKMNPVHFVLNMISLLVFPSAIRLLIMPKMDIDDASFNEIISERKEIIVSLLFKN